jgi:NADH dehydrogenase
MGEMIGIDLNHQRVLLRGEELEYDSLIVATGSENHYYGNDHWCDIAPGLKTIEDALNIRNRVFSAFERAERSDDPAERRRLMTFVIVGGGPTGIELAGALAEIARITLRDDFQSIDTTDARIIVLEGGQEILSGFRTKLRSAAKESLSSLGVEVHTGVFAENIDKKGATVKENDHRRRIDSETVIWAAGIRPSPIAALLADESGLHKTGRIIVSSNLNLPGQDSVFVLGDLAFSTDEFGKALPQTAPVAMSQGRYVARLIVDRLKNNPTKPYRYKGRGNMAVIGRASAIADLGWAQFSGYPAWLLWLFVHLMYLVEFDNRLIVFIQWAWNYFTRNRGARLITYDSSEPKQR